LHRSEDRFSIAEPLPNGQNVAVEPGTLGFGVERAKINWGTFFQDMIRPRESASTQFQNYSGRGPSVVVQNATGEKRVLEVVKTMKLARERAAAVENDFNTLTPAQWCGRYDVPISFLSP
jgi:hypothetical protein